MVAGGKAQTGWLLNFLQDGVLPGPRGMEEMPKVTVLGATTDAGKLPEPFLERFKHTHLHPYTPAEAARISAVMSRRIFFPPLPQPSARNHDQVAEASNRNPRVMRHILEQVRDLTLVEEGANWDGDDYLIDEALSMLGLTRDGLTDTAQRYLLTLLVEFQGEPAGAAAMADRLQEPGGLQYVERVLMDKGLLTKSSRGRQLTSAGIRRARSLL